MLNLPEQQYPKAIQVFEVLPFPFKRIESKRELDSLVIIKDEEIFANAELVAMATPSEKPFEYTQTGQRIDYTMYEILQMVTGLQMLYRRVEDG